MDYGIERRLAHRAPALHRRYRDCMVTSQRMLTRYENYFPDFTDHTVLHTLSILDLCNQLIGSQMERLTAEDLYVLLMGALFQEVGMGGYRGGLCTVPRGAGIPGTGGRYGKSLGGAGLPPGAVGAVSGKVLADAGLSRSQVRKGGHSGLPGTSENESDG